MFDSQHLSYCNQQADIFFGVPLSHLKGEKELQNSEYLLMSNRCLHELKTIDVDRVAQKMENTDHNRSIGVTELGESVLTLDEVL